MLHNEMAQKILLPLSIGHFDSNNISLRVIIVHNKVNPSVSSYKNILITYSLVRRRHVSFNI